MTYKSIKRKTNKCREFGSIIKNGDFFNWGICYPDSYRVATSSLGWQVIYREINALPTWRCERFFYDKAWQDKGRPISCESGRLATDCQIIAMSLYYENDYFNALAMLKAMQLPLRSSERNDWHPLLIAGGPCAIANPLPLASVFDAFVIGEGEQVCQMIAKLYETAAGDCWSREKLLSKLADMPYVYVPALTGERLAKRVFIKDINAFDGGAVIFGGDSVFSDMFLLEIARGCGRGCKFCLAGSIFSPVRFRTLANILETAKRAVGICKRVGLVGTAVADHPQLKEIVAGLLAMGLKSSPASLRADRLDEELASLLLRCDLKTLTIAPEAGSQKLRNLINKSLDEQQIISAAETAAKVGFVNLRFYFMVGLPEEEEEDIRAIGQLMLTVRQAVGKRVKLTASINPFVPKPFTAFANVAMRSPIYYKTVKRELTNELLRLADCRVAWAANEQFFIQAILANGDSNLSEAIILAAERQGEKSFKLCMQECGLNWQEYLEQRRSTSAKEIIDIAGCS